MNKTSGKAGVRLYNVLFPIWLLLILPAVWIVVLPANFIIDSAVLLLAAALLRLGKPGAAALWKKSILRVWLCGFAADLAGAAFLIASHFAAGDGWWYEAIIAPISHNPFENVFALAYVCLAVALSGGLIYWLNATFALRKTALDRRQRRTAALLLAALTAPYLFLLPSRLFYT